MFSINENNEIYLSMESVDLRKGFNTLCGLIRESHLSPTDGRVYLFINRSRNTLKMLHWERGGFVIYHKRLERGGVKRFKSDQLSGFRPIRWDELVLLLEGINPSVKRRKRFNLNT